jgi:hypothetical protein
VTKPAIAACLILICAISFADTPVSQAEELLARLAKEPFHPELICDKIVKLGSEAIPALEAATQSDDPVLRTAALRSLAALDLGIRPHCFFAFGGGLEDIARLSHGKPLSQVQVRIDELKEANDLDGLLDVIKAGDPLAAREAIGAISSLDREADAARAMLASARPYDWFYSGVLLARTAKEVLPCVLEKLASREEADRHAAASALAVSPSAEALEPLLKAVEDRSSLVRRKAAQALGILGDERAAGPLAARLKEDKDSAVRADAAWALGLLKATDETVEALGAALADREELVAAKALESLAVAGGKTALRALSEFARNPGREARDRRTAIQAIGQVGGAEALEQLKPLFGEDDDAYSLVPSVLGSLGEIALPFLRGIIENSDNLDFSARVKLRLALGASGADAVPVLLDMLNSPNRHLCLMGREMLQVLTGKDFEFDRGEWEKYLKENPPR